MKTRAGRKPGNPKGPPESTKWKKGQSGNPGGARAVPPEVREAFKAATLPAALRLIELMDSDDKRISLEAAKTVLEKVYGKQTMLDAPREQKVAAEWAEDALLTRGLAGDTTALLTVLRVLAPDRWGAGQGDGPSVLETVLLELAARRREPDPQD